MSRRELSAVDFVTMFNNGQLLPKNTVTTNLAPLTLDGFARSSDSNDTILFTFDERLSPWIPIPTAAIKRITAGVQISRYSAVPADVELAPDSLGGNDSWVYALLKIAGQKLSPAIGHDVSQGVTGPTEVELLPDPSITTPLPSPSQLPSRKAREHSIFSFSNTWTNNPAYQRFYEVRDDVWVNHGSHGSASGGGESIRGDCSMSYDVRAGRFSERFGAYAAGMMDTSMYSRTRGIQCQILFDRIIGLGRCNFSKPLGQTLSLDFGIYVSYRFYCYGGSVGWIRIGDERRVKLAQFNQGYGSFDDVTDERRWQTRDSISDRTDVDVDLAGRLLLCQVGVYVDCNSSGSRYGLGFTNSFSCRPVSMVVFVIQD
jgi:hypothetical protein